MKRWVSFADETLITTLAGLDARPLTDITQGTGAYQRIGNQIHAKGIYLRGVMHNNAAITNLMRVLVVGFAGDIDITLAAGEFFQDANLAGGTSLLTGGAAGLNSMYYPINKAKFDVIYDRVFKMSPANVDSSDTLNFRKFIKLNRKILFEANVAGQYDQNYRYAILAWTAEAPDDVGVGTTVEFSCHSQFYYTDC